MKGCPGGSRGGSASYFGFSSRFPKRKGTSDPPTYQLWHDLDILVNRKFWQRKRDVLAIGAKRDRTKPPGPTPVSQRTKSAYWVTRVPADVCLGSRAAPADLYAMSVHPRLSDVLFRRAMCSDVPNAMPLLFCAKPGSLSPSLRIEESGEKY
jgi:hypothetical protein